MNGSSFGFYTTGAGGGKGATSAIDVSFTVGQPGYLLNGQNSVTLTQFATGSGFDKIVSSFIKGGIPLINGIDFTFSPSTGKFVLNNMVFVNGETVGINGINNNI